MPDQILTYAAGRPRFEHAATISWVMLALAIGSMLFVGWYVPHDRPEAQQLMQSLHLSLPGSTMAMLSIPDAAFYIAAGVGVLGALYSQWWGGGSINSASVLMLMILLAALVFVLYRESLYAPFVSLMQGISSSRLRH